MATALILSKLKFKNAAELNQIKNAIDTLTAYDLHEDVLSITKKFVEKEIEYRTEKIKRIRKAQNKYHKVIQ
jgi:hypothetical protein